MTMALQRDASEPATQRELQQLLWLTALCNVPHTSGSMRHAQRIAIMRQSQSTATTLREVATLRYGSPHHHHEVWGPAIRDWCSPLA